MVHEIFFKIFDGPQNIFLCSIFVILFSKIKGLDHKKEIKERQGMLNKSHPVSRNKANSGKNFKKCLMYFDPDAIGSFSLEIDTRYNFLTNFLQ